MRAFQPVTERNIPSWSLASWMAPLPESMSSSSALAVTWRTLEEAW